MNPEFNFEEKYEKTPYKSNFEEKYENVDTNSNWEGNFQSSSIKPSFSIDQHYLDVESNGCIKRLFDATTMLNPIHIEIKVLNAKPNDSTNQKHKVLVNFEPITCINHSLLRTNKYDVKLNFAST